MLVKLLPEQIARYWNQIRETLYHTLLPTVDVDEVVLANILHAALSERVQVWVMHEPGSDKATLQAVGLTTFADDLASGTRNLVILSLYGLYESNGDVKNWENAVDTIREFAVGHSCKKLVAYSNKPRAIALAERMGADVSYRFINIEL